MAIQEAIDQHWRDLQVKWNRLIQDCYKQSVACELDYGAEVQHLCEFAIALRYIDAYACFPVDNDIHVVVMLGQGYKVTVINPKPLRLKKCHWQSDGF